MTSKASGLRRPGLHANLQLCMTVSPATSSGHITNPFRKTLYLRRGILSQTHEALHHGSAEVRLGACCLESEMVLILSASKTVRFIG